MTGSPRREQRRVPDLVREYVRQLEAAVAGMLVEVHLFGSFARGDANEDSDVDVLVVLRERDNAARRAAHDLAADLSFEHGVLICPTVVDEPTWRVHVAQQRPLARAVTQEGVRL